jgi:hypothetical protein
MLRVRRNSSGYFGTILEATVAVDHLLVSNWRISSVTLCTRYQSTVSSLICCVLLYTFSCIKSESGILGWRYHFLVSDTAVVVE